MLWFKNLLNKPKELKYEDELSHTTMNGMGEFPAPLRMMTKEDELLIEIKKIRADLENSNKLQIVQSNSQPKLFTDLIARDNILTQENKQLRTQIDYLKYELEMVNDSCNKCLTKTSAQQPTDYIEKIKNIEDLEALVQSSEQSNHQNLKNYEAASKERDELERKCRVLSEKVDYYQAKEERRKARIAKNKELQTKVQEEFLEMAKKATGSFMCHVKVQYVQTKVVENKSIQSKSELDSLVEDIKDGTLKVIG